MVSWGEKVEGGKEKCMRLGLQQLEAERPLWEASVIECRSIHYGSTRPTSPKLTWAHRECSSWFRIMSDDALQPSRACQPTLKPCLFVLTFTPFWRIGIGTEPYDFELNQSLKSGSNVISGLLNLQNKNVNIKNVCTIILESEHFNVAVTLYIISMPELPLITREWALMVHTELYKSHPFLFPLSKKSHKYSLQKLEKTYKHNPCESHGWQCMPPLGRESGLQVQDQPCLYSYLKKPGWGGVSSRSDLGQLNSKVNDSRTWLSPMSTGGQQPHW